MTIERYIDQINQRFRLGNATEHTFRGDLQQLIESIVPDIRATNEPKRQSCGAPDYILTGNSFAKKDIPIGLSKQKTLATKTLQESRKQATKSSSTATRLR